ncbi:MAG: 50S ribosomal protein L1 [Chloroflexi bacterium]|nr:MAG: 50S ribosomal protein L1 [Chloroflexota bacterium]
MAKKHGKKYLEVSKLVDPAKQYSLDEAVSLLKKTAYTKFDSTIEVHMRMGIDPKQADQLVRGVVSLPNGTGKQVRIAVFAEGEGVALAEQAGADVVGGDDLIKRVQDGFTDFDVAVAVPAIMGKVGRLGKILGPRGLMPSPKAGTIVPPQDLPRIIRELRGGRVEFKTDKTANIHVGAGKASFSEQQMKENLQTLFDAIAKAKPAAVKGQYVKTISVAPTMGPGIKLDVNEAIRH